MKKEPLDNVTVLLLIVASFGVGYLGGSISERDADQRVEMSRSLIKLADDACLQHKGAETYTKDMLFVCKDGARIQLK